MYTQLRIGISTTFLISDEDKHLGYNTNKNWDLETSQKLKMANVFWGQGPMPINGIDPMQYDQGLVIWRTKFFK